MLDFLAATLMIAAVIALEEDYEQKGICSVADCRIKLYHDGTFSVIGTFHVRIVTVKTIFRRLF